MNKSNYNHKTRLSATVIAILLGMSGFFNHGLFEVLQGNKATNGFYIEAIGETHRFWLYGTEGAFTLIPNFLITGIFTMLVSCAIIIWAIKFIQTKHGATIFLLLMILLTLVGGGLGHIVLFLPTWAYATMINKPLDWWEIKLSESVRKVLARMWMPMLVLTSLSWLIVMELGIFGLVPNQTNPEIILNITFGFVLLTVLLANLTFISGFARDIEERSFQV
ncbi:hypothetical protein [Cyclobacterium jeungdonense]|uniref:Uncharacterized protein n=1 Tax=Cyclobacterium jeungdonense TaxID=708087 RepID=A0ABT8CBA0_9BACT|nr:hypothetical protein [Cyclobacterium jeungdonense]MDN3689040.1 hypothetical protein [Cyclobacterium jeungdonense]